MAAGHVIMVGFVCLLVGALLNAAGIRKTALGQDVGWERDLATTLADPLYDVSHALYLDRVRSGLQDVIGRGGDDDIDVSLPSPKTAPPAGGTTTTTLPKKKAFSPTKPLRLWVGGDSLSITPGESLVNFAVTSQAIVPTAPVDGHIATGLARPEIFNWAAYLASVIQSQQPDAMVLTFGSNDDQALTGEGGGAPLLTPAWEAEYRRRVGGLMDAVTLSPGAPKLFVVGIPPMANTLRFDTRYYWINAILASEAATRPGRVSYVDTVAAVGIPGTGGYTDFLQNPDGTLVQVRAPDGIHFTRTGGDRIAGAIYAALLEAFDLESWRTTTTTTTKRPTTTTKANAEGR